MSGPPRLASAAVCELQAALAAGAAPGQALIAAAGSGPLAGVARDVRLGRPLPEIAADVASGDPAADLLVRALAVAERTGAGAGAAVEQALTALRDEADLRRLVAVRTAQARGTAVILAGVPLAAWVLLVAMDATALAFYATPVGAATAVAASMLAITSWRLMRRMVRSATDAAPAADPLSARPAAWDWRRGAAVGAGAAVVAGWLLAPAAGAVAGAVGAVLAARRTVRSSEDPARGAVGVGVAGGSGAGGRIRGERGGGHEWLPGLRAGRVGHDHVTDPSPQRTRRAGRVRGAGRDGGAAEAVELVAIALTAGLPVVGALAAVAPLAPSPARPLLARAARRLGAGGTVDAALAGTGLAELGDLLAATERWGAPAEAALRRLATELRADRRAAAEEAAERLQLALVFPTTLLTLPAFVLGVVPPLLWTTLGR